VSAAALLNRLDRVIDCGDGRWRSVCPVHENKNKSRSLSIRETEDGVILIYCFAGCGAGDVVGALGLHLDDLFPENTVAPRVRKSGRPHHYHAAAEALKTLHLEVLIVEIAAERTRRGEILKDAEMARLAKANDLIRAAAEACV